MSECLHGLEADTCSSCKHPYRPPAEPTVDYYLKARYDGGCSSCNLPISTGRIIALMSDGTYRHDSCAQ